MEAHHETAGLGVGLTIEAGVSSESVWTVLLQKIQQPNLFLPVKDVIARPSADGKGTYREMTLVAPGAPERRIIENIYTTGEPLYEVLFVMVDDENEHVNAITTDASGARKLEFFMRNSKTKERVPWPAPKAVVTGGIEKVLKAARESS